MGFWEKTKKISGDIYSGAKKVSNDLKDFQEKQIKAEQERHNRMLQKRKRESQILSLDVQIAKKRKLKQKYEPDNPFGSFKF